MTSITRVNTADLYPTFLEMAGISETKQNDMDGISIAPLLKGKSIDREDMYWQFPHCQGEGAYPSSAIRQSSYELTYNYHYENDLLNQKPDLAASMKFRLIDSLHSVSAKMPIKTPSKILLRKSAIKMASM